MNREEALVSIIMNCYNGEEFLRQSIECVLGQSWQSWELIFWDNCSTDRSREIVESFKDERIKYYLSEEFTPLGEARNRAILQAQGDFIAFLDCDDLWFPEKLKLQIPKFSDSSVGIVYCDTIFFNSEGDVKRLYENDTPYEGEAFGKLLRRYNLSLETVVIRKKLLEKLTTCFDPRFNMIEEMDLFIRLSKVCKLAYVPQVLAKWRIHATSWTFQKKERFPIEREQFLEKMQAEDSSFYSVYAEDVKCMRGIIAKERAIAEFSKGNRMQAQKLLFPFLLSSPSVFLSFVLTFFPFSLYRLIQRRRGNSF